MLGWGRGKGGKGVTEVELPKGKALDLTLLLSSPDILNEALAEAIMHHISNQLEGRDPLEVLLTEPKEFYAACAKAFGGEEQACSFLSFIIERVNRNLRLSISPPEVLEAIKLGDAEKIRILMRVILAAYSKKLAERQRWRLLAEREEMLSRVADFIKAYEEEDELLTP